MRIPLDERIERLTKWFHRENDRALLGFFLGSQYPLHRFEGSKRHLPHGPVAPEDVVVADYLDDCDRLFALHERAGGDLVWSAPPFYGLPWVEAALGCGVVADHDTGSSRTIPPAGFADNPAVPEFSPDDPWVRKLLEFFPALVERSAGRYPVGVTLMRGPCDLLSALYGGEKFLFRMMEVPDEVSALLRSLTDFWIAFGKCLLDHAPLFRGGTSSFFYSVWCPGKTLWTQEDASALLSPDLYEQFIYPCDCRIAEAFEHTVIHLHPSMFIPIDYLVKSEISVIELHVDKGGPSAADLEEHYRRVLAEKPLLVWGDLTEADLEFVLQRLPHKGLAVCMVVSSVDQAEVVWKRAASLMRGS